MHWWDSREWRRVWAVLVYIMGCPCIAAALCTNMCFLGVGGACWDNEAFFLPGWRVSLSHGVNYWCCLGDGYCWFICCLGCLFACLYGVVWMLFWVYVDRGKTTAAVRMWRLLHADIGDEAIYYAINAFEDLMKLRNENLRILTIMMLIFKSFINYVPFPYVQYLCMWSFFILQVSYYTTTIQSFSRKLKYWKIL